MARDCHRKDIRGACLSYSANSLRHSDLFRDLDIASGRAGRNVPKCLPDALLERSSTNVERKIEAEAWVPEEPRDLSGQRLGVGITAEQTDMREALAEVTHA